MNDGKTKSAAGLYTRVDLDEVLYTDNFFCMQKLHWLRQMQPNLPRRSNKDERWASRLDKRNVSYVLRLPKALPHCCNSLR